MMTKKTSLVGHISSTSCTTSIMKTGTGIPWGGENNNFQLTVIWQKTVLQTSKECSHCLLPYHSRMAVTLQIILHSGQQQCVPLGCFIHNKGKVTKCPSSIIFEDRRTGCETRHFDESVYEEEKNEYIT